MAGYRTTPVHASKAPRPRSPQTGAVRFLTTVLETSSSLPTCAIGPPTLREAVLLKAARLDEPVVIGVKKKQLAAPNRDDTIPAACSLDGLFGRVQARRDRSGSLSGRGVQIMLARAVLCALSLACAVTAANALTQEDLLAKLEAAGYSQVRENGSGKIKTFKAVKNGKEVSVIVDSFGRIKKLQ
jgi:hypothetical protein